MALTQPTASALAGTQIGRYTLLGKLAMGGMAEVFLARQVGPMGFAKTVVIKRILPLDEARLAAIINHPHVVQIFELGEDTEAQSFFMAMEYIDGRNLKQVATRALELGSQVSMRVASRIIADAASGLEFAHALKDAHGEPLNLVHRDISAENILVSYAGMVKVVDFGIAKASHMEGRTKTGQVKGKFGYMSPEQLLGQPVDRRADVWALGITLYWLLSGQRPFRGDSEGRIIQQVVSAELPRLNRRGTQVAGELEEIVRTALQKDPNRRFQTAGELQLALDRWIQRNGEPVATGALASLMEQLFPEKTDKDRVLTQALLQGEIQSQDTPWQAHLAKQRKGSSQMSQLPSQLPSPLSGPRSALPRWAAPVGGALGGMLLVLALVVGWQVFHRDSDPLPPVAHRTQAPPLPAPVAGEAPKVDAPKPDAPLDSAQAPGAPLIAPVPDPSTAPSTAPTPPVAPPTEAAHHKLPIAHPHRPAAADAPEEKHAVAGPPGELNVETRPWAIVIIDGRTVGTTPMAPVSVPAGKHKVELVNKDLDAHLIRTVEVKSGETATLREKILAGTND